MKKVKTKKKVGFNNFGRNGRGEVESLATRIEKGKLPSVKSRRAQSFNASEIELLSVMFAPACPVKLRKVTGLPEAWESIRRKAESMKESLAAEATALASS